MSKSGKTKYRWYDETDYDYDNNRKKGKKAKRREAKKIKHNCREQVLTPDWSEDEWL